MSRLSDIFSGRGDKPDKSGKLRGRLRGRLIPKFRSPNIRLWRSKSRNADADSLLTGQTAADRLAKLDKKPLEKRQRTGQQVRYGGFAVALMALILLGLWLWDSGRFDTLRFSIYEGWHGALAGLGFKVSELKVDGRVNTSPEDIQQAAATYHGSSLFKADVYAIKSRLESLDWVYKAKVERRWPNQIYIHLFEHIPAAVLRLSDGRLRLISLTGHNITAAYPEDLNQFILVTGKGSAKHIGPLLETLEQDQDLRQGVYAAVRISNRRWNIQMHSGIQILLPEKEFMDAWQKFATMLQTRNLLAEDLSVIDLRIPGRIVMQPKGQPALESHILPQDILSEEDGL